MRWQGRRESDNVEDRRRESSSLGGGLGGMIPLKGKGGILLFVVVLVAGYYGVDLSPLLNGAGSDITVSQTNNSDVDTPEQQEAAKFTSVVLASTEDVWSKVFNQMGKKYTPPKLVLYTGYTRTGCGTGQAVMGPFYCPVDSTVYIDLSFYREMKNKLGGGGDFAQGYVVAHEVGHHVQNLLGIADQVRRMQQGQPESVVNQLSVKMELQADCYAGIWGHYMDTENVLENGDLEKALQTAQAIGDDRLQQQSTGRIVPDSFTHGTSEQRYNWFKRGFENGDLKQCDTFASSN